MKVLDGSNTVVEYEYDGMNRRIVKKLYTGGVLTQTRHRYHAPGKDQVIEERVDASTIAERQFTWGTRYIYDLVMRTRDTDANGTLDETLYPLSDITYDVVAPADSTGAVVERLLYDPYGKSKVLDANFAADAGGVSDYDWEYRFTSREWDKETGLDHFRARYYEALLGRFMNRDPSKYKDGLNLSAAYFPLRGTDPTGKACKVTYSCRISNIKHDKSKKTTTCKYQCKKTKRELEDGGGDGFTCDDFYDATKQPNGGRPDHEYEDVEVINDPCASCKDPSEKVVHFSFDERGLDCSATACKKACDTGKSIDGTVCKFLPPPAQAACRIASKGGRPLCRAYCELCKNP